MNRLFRKYKHLCRALGLFTVIAALSLTAVPAHGDRGSRGRWWNTPQIAETLQLTESEIQKLDEMYDDATARMIELRGQLKVAKLQLRMLLGRPDFDITEVVIQRQKEKQLYSQIADERFGFLLKTRKLIGHERFNQLMLTQEARSRHRHNNGSKDAEQ